jgi:hypothetical protein
MGCIGMEERTRRDNGTIYVYAAPGPRLSNGRDVQLILYAIPCTRLIASVTSSRRNEV